MSPNAKSVPLNKAGPNKEWLPEVAPNVLSLVPYQPGKPIEETQREFGLSSVIKLASNENPLGPSPLAVRAVQEKLREMHLYPDAAHFELKQALARHLEVSPLHLSIGTGSNEFIDLLMRIFVPKGKNVVSPAYSFIAYRLCAQLAGCDYVESPTDENFGCSAESILKTVNEDTRMVMLANPNNPTGTWLGTTELHKLASALNERRILLVLDYAYWEYVAQSEIPSPEEMLGSHANVMVLRTFSKIYGLAGLRVGYVVARPDLITIVERSRQPFNVSSPGLWGAKAALQDQEFVAESRKRNLEGKSDLVAFLARFSLKVHAGEGNFVLVDLGRPAQTVYNEFLKHGVILRPLANYGLFNHLRISIGSSQEHHRFVKAMERIWS